LPVSGLESPSFGWILQYDITWTPFLVSASGWMKGWAMKTISRLLEEKGRFIWSVGPKAKVFEALRLMAEKDVGALLVMDGEKLVGIFSERDYARKVILKHKSSKHIAVREIMSSEVVSASPDLDCEQALALMTARHIRHLPVVENDQIVGVVSIGDLVKAVIDYHKQDNKALNQYILEKVGML
jgi:predicted transcriptional regulator